MPFVKIGALWKAKSGKGWTGELDIYEEGKTKIYVSENRFKKSDKHPDLIINEITEDEEEKPRQQEPPSIDDDDIPF